MLPLLRDLARHPRRARTLILVDEEAAEPARPYTVRPLALFAAGGGLTLALAVLLAALVLLTPLRRVVYGPDPGDFYESARLTALRAVALADSLEMHRAYLAVLRSTITGIADTAEAATVVPLAPPPAPETPPLELSPGARSEDWAHHVAPGLSLARLDVRRRPAAEAYLAALQFPALPPVDGFFARGYDAARGHFGIDLAVAEGTPVRAIGDGFVVFADWTNDGGFTIAVQHSGGYLSIYKHNSRLLKRVGDRVLARETIALSGNTGEITTGPHLHFELWRDGLAQDPRLYLVGF